MAATWKTWILGWLAVLAAGLMAAPSAAASQPDVDVGAWVRQNTDLPLTQVAVAGLQNVYGLEPLGPPLPTGEVIALVRTEAMTAAWGDAHGFRSWDAHILFDCNGSRLRVIRSARYPEPNRGGAPVAETEDAAWFAPRPGEPAARLLAAACDPAFAWPLRGASGPVAQPAPAEARPIIASAERVVRVARGPDEGDAGLGETHREMARPGAVPAAAASKEACCTLLAAGQGRPRRDIPSQAAAAVGSPGEAPLRQAETTSSTAALAAAAAGRTAAAVERQAAARTSVVRPQAVQLAHGPAEAVGWRPLHRVQLALGRIVDGVKAVADPGRFGRRRREAALLASLSPGAPPATADLRRTADHRPDSPVL